MSPRPSPCDGHTGDLPAYLDHELPDMQDAALEQHLERCPRCQARLRELEAVSAVLKGWDVGVPAAPARLARGVLARVEAAGEARRRVRLRRRAAAFALAAAVLVALGTPILLARLGGGEPAAPAPFERSVASAPNVVPGAPLPAPQVDPLPSDLVAHAPWTGRPGGDGLPADPLLADPAAREAFVQGALDAQVALEMEREFERRVGVRGVWVSDIQDGVVRRLLVTPEAARAFAPDDLFTWLRAKHAETTSLPRSAAPRTLALTPGDLLAEQLAGQPDAPVLYTLFAPGAARTPLLHVRALTVGAPRPGLEGPQTLDPLLAQERGQLRLEPAPHDVALLNAVVRATEHPILLPAGHIVTGGETDLVVARSTWLPASTGQEAWQVPCVVVRSGARRAEPVARLTPFVAGPALRAALLAEADAESVRALVRRQVGASLGGATRGTWSLLDLYDLATDGQLLGQVAAVAAGAPAGVLASDGARFLGLEHVNVGGEGATPLLARLLHGYVWEAQRRARFEAGFGAPGAPLGAAVQALRDAREALVERPAPVVGMAAAEVSRATRVDPTQAAEALRVDGRRVAVSVLPR